MLGMLLLVLPMTAQDTIPMPSQEGAWLHDESGAPAVSPVMGQGAMFEEAEMLDIEEKPKPKEKQAEKKGEEKKPADKKSGGAK